jgi:uncharacterized phage protein (TIGR01671 family)
MREIKFRAWITIEPKTIEDEYETRMIYGIERAAEHNPPPHNMLSLSDFEEALELAGRTPPLVILMQFTGLKDKNGKEIYEGDIIRFDDITSDAYILRDDNIVSPVGSTVGIVKWFDDIAGFKPESIEKNHSGGHYRSVWDFCENIEVIGNIYENGELLR